MGNPDIITSLASTRVKNSYRGLLSGLFVFVLSVCLSAPGYAGTREQLQRMHDRLTGIAPDTAILAQMQAAYNADTGDTEAKLIAAARIAMDNAINASFYNVTLKNFATPWTNEAQTVFAPLNDYSAMVIGMIRDEKDFRELLFANYYYYDPNLGVPAANNNTHFETLENTNANLKTVLQEQIQPVAAPAGVMTTRAAARAFFIDGTNRAMLRFTVLNHLCYDMEQLKDTTRPADRIRQDVSRSPGGDSRIYLNNCIGCHAGMDPLAQAFANYEWDYKDNDPMTEDDPEAGTLQYTAGVVQPKYHINDNNFKGGYRTPDGSWTNYWRQGSNRWLGWGGDNNNAPVPVPPYELPPLVTIDPQTGISSGPDARSLGQELAYSDAFARCQVKKVFRAVCLRNPENIQGGTEDTTKYNSMVTNFKGGYNMKDVFAEAAAHCSGD